jgi:hypothetical protein
VTVDILKDPKLIMEDSARIIGKGDHYLKNICCYKGCQQSGRRHGFWLP